MKEIKRYTGNTYHDLKKIAHIVYTEEIDGDLVKYTDHKAVVEVLEKDLEVSGSAVNDLIDLVDELKGKIEELEKELKESLSPKSAKGIK